MKQKHPPGNGCLSPNSVNFRRQSDFAAIIGKYLDNQVSSKLTHTYRYLQIVTIQEIVTDTECWYRVGIFPNTYRYFNNFSQTDTYRQDH